MMLKRKNGGYFVIIDVRQQRFGHMRCKFYIQYCQRPYHVELTRSRQLPEVKLRRVPLVLGWVTAWEYGMLLAFLFSIYSDFNMTNTIYL
jgi:hypothetical protein